MCIVSLVVRFNVLNKTAAACSRNLRALLGHNSMLVYYVCMCMYVRLRDILCVIIYMYTSTTLYIIYQYAVTLQECNVLNTCTMVMLLQGLA